jgi:hypothetical protein
MAGGCQTPGERSHFYRRTTPIEKGIVGLGYMQKAHRIAKPDSSGHNAATFKSLQGTALTVPQSMENRCALSLGPVSGLAAGSTP